MTLYIPKLTPQEFVQGLRDLADMGHPELLEAFQQAAEGLVTELNAYIQAHPEHVYIPRRYRNRIIARAAQHVGLRRRGSNGWRHL